MKIVLRRICCLIAMAISLLSFGLLISAQMISMGEITAPAGESASFSLWVYSVIAAMVSVFLYIADLTRIIGTGKNKAQKLFNGILTTLVLLGVSMVLFVGGGLGINIAIWGLYHVLLFVLEGISIVAEVKREKQKNP